MFDHASMQITGHERPCDREAAVRTTFVAAVRGSCIFLGSRRGRDPRLPFPVGTSIEFQRIEDGHLSLLLGQSRGLRSRSTATGGVAEMAGNVGAFPSLRRRRDRRATGRAKGPHQGSASRKEFSVDETRRATGPGIILCMARFVERKMIEFAMFLKIFVPGKASFTWL